MTEADDGPTEVGRARSARVASYTLDVLEQLFRERLELSEDSRAVIARLAGLSSPEDVLADVLRAAAVVVREQHAQAASPTLPHSSAAATANEGLARAFLSARRVLRDQAPSAGAS